ncbi:MAG: hypothetical protein ACPL5F_01600 [Moorellaceae bacterium]
MQAGLAEAKGLDLDEVEGVMKFLAVRGIDLSDYPSEVLQRNAVPILILHRSFEACQKCQKFEDCGLWSLGWVPVYDPDASKKYGWPYFRWRMCQYRKQWEEMEAKKQKRKTRARIEELGAEVPLEQVPQEVREEFR